MDIQDFVYSYLSFFLQNFLRRQQMNIKNYGFPVFRFLNQWEVTLFCSHNVKPIDHYVSVDSLGRYSLVYVFKREEAKELLKNLKTGNWK